MRYRMKMKNKKRDRKYFRGTAGSVSKNRKRPGLRRGGIRL